MKVTIVNYSDRGGGAARATDRICRALKRGGVDVAFSVAKASEHPAELLNTSVTNGVVSDRLRRTVGRRVAELLNTGNPVLHSPSVVSSRWPRFLNGSDADIVQLHWVCNEMMSIADIGRIHKPVVWRLSDMWAFCGAEHYTFDTRWKEGYVRNNRPVHESGFDLNRWVWKRKKKWWRKPFQIVAPSEWLANCVKESALMEHWPVSVIPNALDVDYWHPVDKKTARELLGLPLNVPLVVFGAIGGTRDQRKGSDILLSTVHSLATSLDEFEVVIFGEDRPPEAIAIDVPMHYVGHAYDDLTLKTIYGAADVLVIPSRQDNSPNIAVEAHACGRPVAAFNTTGLPDIVRHKHTGWLAKPFDAEDLANGIYWILAEKERLNQLGMSARDHAKRKFAYEVVAKQYMDMYEGILGMQ